ncbi:hypothetical protein FRC01_004674 [Tulasnella sp. 417]|nr:hypothetical protein FRC01_004674 [Tulasnella sp. 417]
MPWHKSGSILHYIRSNRERFGNPDKPQRPDRRSGKALSEHRANQGVGHVSWWDDQPEMNKSDGETSDDSSTESLETEDEDDEDEENETDEVDDEDEEATQDSTPRPPCGLDAADNEDLVDELIYSEGSVQGTLEVEEHSRSSNEDKGKAPSALNRATVLAMVKTLSENPDVFYGGKISVDKSDRRRKLWVAFAKSAYFGYHKAHHANLESMAKSLNQGRTCPPNTEAHEFPTSTALGVRRPPATKTAPASSKRPIGDDERSKKPPKKAKLSHRGITKSSFSKDPLDVDPWLQRLANPAWILVHCGESKRKITYHSPKP